MFLNLLCIEISTRSIKIVWGYYNKPKIFIKGYSILKNTRRCYIKW